jgi:beta-galactosidase
MTDCFGMSYNQFSNPGKTTVQGKKVNYFMEFLKPGTAEVFARYEHRYWGEYAAVTRNPYGSGTAYYVGTFLEKEQLKEIYKKAAEDAKIDTKFGGITWPLTVRSGCSGEGHELHYIFNYSEDERQLVCPLEKATDLLTGAAYKKGDIITLTDWDLVILQE